MNSLAVNKGIKNGDSNLPTMWETIFGSRLDARHRKLSALCRLWCRSAAKCSQANEFNAKWSDSRNLVVLYWHVYSYCADTTPVLVWDACSSNYFMHNQKYGRHSERYRCISSLDFYVYGWVCPGNYWSYVSRLILVELKMLPRI
jgi:hypothetical protein